MPSKKEIEALVVEYVRTRNERLKLQQEADIKEEREKSILASLTAANVASGTYGKMSIEVSKKKVPRCTDWPGFHAYIKQTGNFDMLHKRLTETAVMARMDNNEYVPGIVTDEKTAYKFTLA